MPVTIKTASHSSELITNEKIVSSPEQLFKASCPREFRQCKGVIQSSFNNLSHTKIFSARNGFVHAASLAYSGHHHLTIRPEDVWLSILTQFSFYVNANAEKLRSFFVAHQDQKELIVFDDGDIYSADFGEITLWMTHQIEQNVVDPELRKWIMPDFSTTTRSDTVTAAIVMMGSMQQYFKYICVFTCGIPSVTLLGEKEDWIKIRQRLDYLPRFSKEAERFAILLKVILEYFIRSFDEPTHPEVISFWSRIAREDSGSGSSYLSGWITAFCFWEADGKCLHTLPTEPKDVSWFQIGCDLDGTLFHKIDMDDVPEGFMSVPMVVVENGIQIKTRMVAGSIGIKASSSGELIKTKPPQKRQSSNTGGKDQIPVEDLSVSETGPDSIQPVSGWWIYKTTENETGK
ncbi:hypothetical protein F5Y02DRAFT_429141 [Annulohypoxylon stygium]|nr:hypothetical protein F5Y02DRAFT_429141 [Annulohypoxylon stygium]